MEEYIILYICVAARIMCPSRIQYLYLLLLFYSSYIFSYHARKLTALLQSATKQLRYKVREYFYVDTPEHASNSPITKKRSYQQLHSIYASYDTYPKHTRNSDKKRNMLAQCCLPSPSGIKHKLEYINGESFEAQQSFLQSLDARKNFPSWPTPETAFGYSCKRRTVPNAWV